MSVSDANAVLAATSRTFSIAIGELPPRLSEAVTSSYLCARAIDEIEDHPTLDRDAKIELLHEVSRWFQMGPHESGFPLLFQDRAAVLPEVTLRIEDWAALAPSDIAPRIADAAAAMADRMSGWVACGWNIQTESDFDRYAFAVSGALGLLLSDLWGWYDGTPSNRSDVIAAARGLQAFNILVDRSEDLARGVDFFPHGWDTTILETYTTRNLRYANRYVASLPDGPVLRFCRSLLTQAWDNLDAFKRSDDKA